MTLQIDAAAPDSEGDTTKDHAVAIGPVSTLWLGGLFARDPIRAMQWTYNRYGPLAVADIPFVKNRSDLFLRWERDTTSVFLAIQRHFILLD